MTNRQAIGVIKFEIACVNRQDTPQCTRDCKKCDLCLPTEDVLQTYNMAIKALEQEPTDKSNLEKICEELAAENDMLHERMKRQTGHWIYDENAHDWNLGGWTCSRCRFVNQMIPTSWETKKGKIDHTQINPMAFNGSSYCAGCGADMRGKKNE